MAQVKIEGVIESMNDDVKRALEDAFRRVAPELSVNRNQLYREVVRAIGRKCPVWARVPDRYIRLD